jgi:hypothetical protein
MDNYETKTTVLNCVVLQSCHPSDARVINLITASTNHPTCAAYTVHIYSAFILTVDSWAADQKARWIPPRGSSRRNFD